MVSFALGIKNRGMSGMKVLDSGSIHVLHICIDLWVYIVPREIENTCIVCYIELIKGLQPTLDVLMTMEKRNYKIG